MAESTIPMPDGKAVGCGQISARTSCGISREEKAQKEKSCISKFGPIRWLGNGRINPLPHDERAVIALAVGHPSGLHPVIGPVEEIRVVVVDVLVSYKRA